MSESLEFPRDRYQSLPHLRLTKKKYLVIENNSVYYVKLHDDHSLFTFISHCSEIQKGSALMHRSKNGNYLMIYLHPREGKKVNYLIRNRAGLGYSPDDWQQIPEFFRNMDFHPEPLPPKDIRLEEVQKAYQVTGPYRYFARHDKIFHLCENPEFVTELKSIKINIFYLLCFIFGLTGILTFGIFGIVDYLTFKTAIWVGFPISTILSGLGYSSLAKYSRKRKEFAERYDIKYYF